MKFDLFFKLVTTICAATILSVSVVSCVRCHNLKVQVIGQTERVGRGSESAYRNSVLSGFSFEEHNGAKDLTIMALQPTASPYGVLFMFHGNTPDDDNWDARAYLCNLPQSVLTHDLTEVVTFGGPLTFGGGRGDVPIPGYNPALQRLLLKGFAFAFNEESGVSSIKIDVGYEDSFAKVSWIGSGEVNLEPVVTIQGLLVPREKFSDEIERGGTVETVPDDGLIRWRRDNEGLLGRYYLSGFTLERRNPSSENELLLGPLSTVAVNLNEGYIKFGEGNFGERVYWKVKYYVERR